MNILQIASITKHSYLILGMFKVCYNNKNFILNKYNLKDLYSTQKVKNVCRQRSMYCIERNNKYCKLMINVHEKLVCD